MSPDSALGQLAQRLAKAEQRLDDLMLRVVEKFSDAERSRSDLRKEVRELRDDFRREVHDLHDEVAALQKTERDRNTMFKVAAIGLMGTFISSGGLVLVAILTGGHL